MEQSTENAKYVVGNIYYIQQIYTYIRIYVYTQAHMFMYFSFFNLNVKIVRR